jgi:hypothetical protein
MKPAIGPLLLLVLLVLVILLIFFSLPPVADAFVSRV